MDIKKAFTKSRLEFIKYLDVSPVLDHLISVDLLETNDQEEIEAQSTNEDKVREFLRILERLPTVAYECVLEELRKKRRYDELVSKIDGLIGFKGKISPSPGELYGVPLSPPGFIDRPHYIQAIRDNLKKLHKKQGWLLVHGMSGIGKSILAASAVQDEVIRKLYSDGVFWISLGEIKENSEKLPKLQSLIEMLDPDSTKPPPAFEAPALTRLNYLLKKRKNALVIIDDAWDDLRSFDLEGHVMVTSREADVLDRTSNREKIKIPIDEGFSWPECQAALRYWLTNNEDETGDVQALPDEAKELYNQCQGSPLAISMLGPCLQERPDRLSDYIILLKANELEDIEHTDSNTYAHAKLETAITISLDHLKEKDKVLEGKYEDIAVFDDDTSLSVELLSVLWSYDEFKTEMSLKKLVNKSLLHEKQESSRAKKSYGIHDLQLKVLKVRRKDDMVKLNHTLTENYSRPYKGQWHKVLTKDDYIWWRIAHHLHRGNDNDTMVQGYTDLKFIEAKIRRTGPGDAINDIYKYFRLYIERGVEKERKAFLDFLQSNADILALCSSNPRSPSLIQLALCQPHDSVVYRQGLQLARKSKELYWIWSNSEMAFKRPMWSTRAFKEMMCCSSISADEKRILAGNDQGNLVVLDSHSGLPIFSFQAHEQNTAINQCEFDAECGRFITCGQDGRLCVFKMPEFAREIGRLLPCGLAPIAYIMPYTWRYTEREQPTAEALLIHCIEEKEEDKPIEIHCFTVASSGKFILAGLDDGRVKYYALAAEGKLTEEKQYKIHSQCVTSIHLHPSDSRLFVSSSPEGSVKVVDLERGECLRDYEGHKLDEQSPEPRVAGFLPEPIQRDGALVASFANTAIHVWNYKTGDCIKTFKEQYEVVIVSVVFSHDGRFVAAGTGTNHCSVKVWSYETKRVLYQLFGHAKDVNMVHFMGPMKQLDYFYIDVELGEHRQPIWHTANEICGTASIGGHGQSDGNSHGHSHEKSHAHSHEQSHEQPHDLSDGNSHGHSHEKSHGHSHEQSHEQPHDHSDGTSHGHSHEKSHEQPHEHTDGSSHGHSHEKSHGYSHEQSHEQPHEHTDGSLHGHSHEQSHSHSHGHSHEQPHGHSHEQSHGHSHGHSHGGPSNTTSRRHIRNKKEDRVETTKGVANVLSGSCGATLLVWDVQNYHDETETPSPEQLRLPLKLKFESWFGDDGRILVIGQDTDRKIEFLSGADASSSITPESEKLEASVFAINFTGTRAAVGYMEGKIEVYELTWSDKQRLVEVRKMPDFVASLNKTTVRGLLFANQLDEEVLVCTDDSGTITLVSMRDSPKQSTSWLGHSASIPHCRHLTAKEQLLTIGEDGFVKLWTMDFGKVGSRLETAPGFPIHQRKIVNVDVDSSETRLVTCSNDGSTKVWDLPSGTLLNTLRTEEESLSALVCRFCPGREDLLAMGDSLGHVRIWQLLTEDKCQQYRLSSDLDRSSSDERERRLSSEAERPSIGVNDLSWSPDGRTVVSISDKVRAWTVDMTALTNGEVDRPPIRTFYMRGRFACHLRAVSDRLVTVDNAGTLYILGDVRSLGEGDVGLPVES